MTTPTSEFPTETILSDIQDRIVTSQNQNRELIKKALSWIDVTVADNDELRTWLNSRIKSHTTAGHKLEEIIKCGHPVVTLFSHNSAGENRIGFSLLKNVDGKFAACITIDKYWHQGPHNSGHHWKQIIFQPYRTADISIANSNVPDSFWILEMSRAMQGREETKNLLFAMMKAKIQYIEKYGDFD